MKRKILSLTLVAVLGITSFSLMGSKTTYASTSENINQSIENKNNEVSNIFDLKDNKIILQNKKAITNKVEIEKIAKEHNIPLEDNGIPISKIEMEYVESSNDSDKSVKASIKNVKDYGSSWYNASDDLFLNVTTSGPDTLKISKTSSFTATMTNSFGVSKSSVSASMGFTIGGSYSITFSSTTPVNAGQRLNVKAYTTYLKKSGDVYSILGNYKGTVFAYKPNGAYFLKTWY